jgi:chorismate synthase
MGNTFGRLFRVTTFGESHGPVVGAVVDGCPPRIPLSEEDIQVDLDRRRPGREPLATPRSEEDRVRILSGVFEGRTLGTPILLQVENRDARPQDYEHLREVFRPSHGDFTWQSRFGVRDHRGGGRASARETVGRVAAGAVARRLLDLAWGVEILAWVGQIHDLVARVDPEGLTREQVEATPVRCPDLKAAEEMQARIHQVREEGDSLGGVVEVLVRGLPAGWGAPVFGKLQADLGAALLGLPAARGFEIGSGFSAPGMRGSEHNDLFCWEDGRLRTRTNRSGGVQAGISNGEDLRARVAFKPVPTLGQPLESVDHLGRAVLLQPGGRHDTCIAPRAVPVVEAMVALVLADHGLLRLALSPPAHS